MKAYRYNAKTRTDRKFNTTGREKNPLNLKFYANSLENAAPYKTIYDRSGYEVYNCELEVVEIENVNLFDMSANFSTTKAYKAFVSNEINTAKKDYEYYLNNAKTKKDKKRWSSSIENLKNRESELAKMLKYEQYQRLSDFEYQYILVEELKNNGYDGYFTEKEIALFN